MALPYKIATLLYCFNAADEPLLLLRKQEPNRDLWSPCGGKLHMADGESPYACACREAAEELGVKLQPQDLHLTGIVSEHGYEGHAHWLMFLFEVKPKLTALPPPHREGEFAFFPPTEIASLKIPRTDAEMIWPLFWKHRGGFFSAHCRCLPDGKNEWSIEEGEDIPAIVPHPDISDEVPAPPIIDLQSDHYFMGEALRQAARAYEAAETPIGAVIVREGRIIARAFNQVELLKDATAHAEMLAITQAEETTGDWRLTGCTLYVTKEPCAMCAGGIVHSRIPRVVYGAGDPKGGGAGGAVNLLQFPTFNHKCDITRGVREPECRTLLQTFFAEQRKAVSGSFKVKI